MADCVYRCYGWHIVKNRLRLILILGFVAVCGWCFYPLLAVWVGHPTSYEESLDTAKLHKLEPELAAGRSYYIHHYNPSVSVNSVTPLRFGGIVNIDDGMFIELTPDGELFSSGEVSGQTRYSYIGDTNLANLAANEFYQTHPGILEFEVNGLQERGTVTLEFVTGVLDEGITLSNLSIDIGNADGLIPVAPASNNTLNYSNRIEFSAVENIGSTRVRIAYGGRLSIDGDSARRGALSANLPIRISAHNPQDQWRKCAHQYYYCRVPGPAIVRYGANGRYHTRDVSGNGIRCNDYNFGDPAPGVYKRCDYQLKTHSSSQALATVYEHTHYQGRSWKLNEERYYSFNELVNGIGNDIISSIKVAPGYKLKACEHSHFGGECRYFSGDISNLINLNYNDLISSVKVIRH
jgi:hypothetical protein